MKSKTANVLIIFLVVFGGILGYLVGERFAPTSYPSGTVLVKQSFLDSLSILPDTVYQDTIVWRDTTIYKDRPIPTPIPTAEPEIVMYVDSLVNDSTYLVIKDKIQGVLLERQIDFARALSYRFIRIPYPVIVDRPVVVPNSPPFTLYGDIAFGGNANAFLLGGEVGFINKSQIKFGAQVLTNFEDRFYIIKLGKSFNF